MKKCCTCKTYLPLASFYKSVQTKDKKHPACKQCHAATRRRYYLANKVKASKDNKAWRGTKDGKYRYAKSVAKYRGLCWEISEDEFHKLSEANCFYCGLSKETSTMAGIDRVDSSIGYTLANSVSCCFRCNAIFGHHDKNDQLRHLMLILKHTKTL